LLLFVVRPEYLFDLLCYYKVYPVSRTSCALYLSNSAVNFRGQLDMLHKWEKYLASVIDEMQHEWDARFDVRNRLPHVFDSRVTGSVDSFPIEIQRPSDGTQAQYYNGKYKKHIVKVCYKQQQICV
jgi:hypothetical protein